MLSRLPSKVRHQARTAYRTFVENPQHPGLHFERIHSLESIYSASVGIHYRAVGLYEDNVSVWFWIGRHGEYDQLIAQMRKRSG